MKAKSLKSFTVALAAAAFAATTHALLARGLTATMGVALLTTLTLRMPSNLAILVLICTYVGAIYGGSRSAILLNIPGTLRTPRRASTGTRSHARRS